MFKFEVNVNGTIYGRYWMNKHSDDFIQFLPAQFSREYGEVISKNEIAIYKIDEAIMPVFEAKMAKHEANELDASETGKLKIIRKDDARVAEGEYMTLEAFNKAKAKREEIFADAVSPQTVSVPATIQHDFGSGTEEDAVQIPAGHELASAYESLEFTATGTLVPYPYDNDNNFIGV